MAPASALRSLGASGPWPLATAAALATATCGVLLRHKAQANDAKRIAEFASGMDRMRAEHKDDASATFTAVLTNAQGLKLFVRRWEPTPRGKSEGRAARGLVLMVHGMTVEGGVFAEAAKHLAGRGFAVVAPDLQGHGLSDCFEGLRGYVRAFEDWVADTELVLGWAKELYPGVPIFLVGESMGGTVVLQALRQTRVAEQVRGAVLLAPAIRVSPKVLPPKAVMPLLLTLAKWFPRTQVPNDPIVQPGNWMGAFGDRAYAEKAFKDPLNTVVPSRLRMTSMLPVFHDLAAHLEDISTPFLVAHAPSDARAEFANSVELVARAKTQDKELMEVADGNHMLLHDRPDISASVLARLTSWLEERSAGR